MQIRSSFRTVKLVALGLLVLAVCVSAQSPRSSDATQIAGLMSGLSDHSKTATEVLDPSLNPSDRDKNLSRLKDPHYELTLVSTGDIPANPGESASVPVRVHFKTENGEIETSSTAHFIKRNNTWYFSNFDFLSFPTFLIVVIVACVLLGIAYAATVLVLRGRLVRQGQLGAANAAKIFIPIYWPALFRRTR
jgi:hypothetical protein